MSNGPSSQGKLGQHRPPSRGRRRALPRECRLRWSLRAGRCVRAARDGGGRRADPCAPGTPPGYPFPGLPRPVCLREAAPGWVLRPRSHRSPRFASSLVSARSRGCGRRAALAAGAARRPRCAPRRSPAGSHQQHRPEPSPHPPCARPVAAEAPIRTNDRMPPTCSSGLPVSPLLMPASLRAVSETCW